MGQQQGRRRSIQNVGQTILRIGRVQRHIGAAGAGNGKDADHQFQRARQADGHPHFLFHAGAAQAIGQLVYPAIQLRIGQLLLAHGQRNGIRCFLCLQA